MGVERATEFHFTLDGSATLKAQISDATLDIITNNVEVTNFASTGIVERVVTTHDFNVSVTLSNPESDESQATSIDKILYDGSELSTGDGVYTVNIQKVSSGGTGGTATTKDPVYVLAMVCTGGWSPVMGNPSGVVGGGRSVTFSNATAATFARNTS